MIEQSDISSRKSESTTLTNRFITAWVNFCTSVVALKSNEKSFQAWFASSLIQEFGLARVYREVNLDKASIKDCFSDPSLRELFPKLYSKLDMDGNELFPDICISKSPNLDTRHPAARPKNTQEFKQIISEICISTELKVAASTYKATATQYNKIYYDVLKLGLIMNAARENEGLPLCFACVLDNLEKAQPEEFVQQKYIQRLQEDVSKWPVGWTKPTLMVTAPIQTNAESEWRCYLIDGKSDWQKNKIVTRFPTQFSL